MARYIRELEARNDLLRISNPVDVKFEAGCIADYLVKNGGPAVIFDQPRLADGSISKYSLAMNLFGTRERTNLALGVKEPKEIGDRMVALMKPDIGGILKAPWKGLGLAMEGMSMAPKRVKKAACQQIVIDDPDLNKLPIPTTWPLDGGPFMTLPLVITADSKTGEHNMGMYRSQVFGSKELGLHWQAHKHGADHAAESEDAKMPIAICLGGPPEIIFSAISPLPDNLSEYEFAGLLGKKRLKIVKCKTNDLFVPAECDFVIEGYMIPGETRLEGPFGDHFGHYSLADYYPVMHVTKITHRKDPIIPMTIVGVPPMEDGYLGEAIGDSFRPVLQFQHRDVIDLFLPLETGFHNLAIVSSKQRYPRQSRKTALGLLGAGQMMFLKTIIAVDKNHPVKDLDCLLDAIESNVNIPNDLVFLEGMVADTLEHASPIENIHTKLLIDATSENSEVEEFDKNNSNINSVAISASAIEGIIDVRMLRPSMMVVTTNIEGGPKPEINVEEYNEEAAEKQRNKIRKICEEVWNLESSKNLRWLFITDDDINLKRDDWKRKLLWQLFCRFDVGRDIHFDKTKQRVAWDATAPIPSKNGPLPVRRWPAVTLHDKDMLEKVQNMMKRMGY
ncbi:MAG: UbiD family decarboxylase [Candidatus Thalassarchaeaceae archaeon]|nr:UbiD family decarboxylase [Candidatus Thalassarchaeaceae archaeon]